MDNFSQKLTDRIIVYFQDCHDVEISNEQAEQYLGSLADLYMAISKAEKRPRDAF